MTSSTIKSRNGEWWFSDIERDSDIFLTFHIPEDKLPKQSELDDILKNTTFTKWPLNKHTHCYNIDINVKTDFDTDSTIPYSQINTLISDLNKYDATTYKMLISFFSHDIDLTPLDKMPEELEISSCFCEILIIPPNDVMKRLCINGDAPTRLKMPITIKSTSGKVLTTNMIPDSMKKLIIVKIPFKNLSNLQYFNISGSYTLHDSVYNDFKYLKRLEDLNIIEENVSCKKHHKLPHLEYCKRLKGSAVMTRYLPKHLRMIQGFNQSPLVALCRKLRRDPIVRLVDITLGLWSLRLPTYVILWITDWLPESDWYSKELVKSYKGAKLPDLEEWGIKEHKKIRIIESINVNKPTLRNPNFPGLPV